MIWRTYKLWPWQGKATRTVAGTVRGRSKTPSTVRICDSFLLMALVGMSLIGYTQAAFVYFENCLSPDIIKSSQLQWVPMNVSVHFDTSAPTHNLNFTMYGNVKGFDPLQDGNATSIVNVSSVNVLTTLISKFNVLSYTPYDSHETPFCNKTLNTPCPIANVSSSINA